VGVGGVLLCARPLGVLQVLLDDYEKGMTSARLDQIFQEVRHCLLIRQYSSQFVVQQLALQYSNQHLFVAEWGRHRGASSA
jgi:Zn-dependent M32 family carboxypeptidase